MADETVAAEQEQEIEAEANEIDELNKKLDEANAALEKRRKNICFFWQSSTTSANAQSRKRAT